MQTRIAFKKWYHNGLASPLAGLIALWTGGKYSHVELIIDVDEDNHPLEIGFSASAWDNEVRMKPIDFNNGKWDIIETGRKIDMDYIASVLGDGYDYTGIVLCEFIPFGIHVKNRNYCSETVSCAIGLNKCQKDPVKLHNFILDENERITREPDIEEFTPYNQYKEDEAFKDLDLKLNGENNV